MKNKKRIKFLEEQVELILEMLLGEEEVVVEEEQDFEVGKWYKAKTDVAQARFTEKGKLNVGYVHEYWCKSILMDEVKYWQEMTPEEIKITLTKRCTELGLFDGEFECLTGKEKTKGDNGIAYAYNQDKLYIGNNVAYKKGKFAEKLKTVEKTFLEELTEWLPLDTGEDFQKWLDGFEIKKRNDYGEF